MASLGELYRAARAAEGAEPAPTAEGWAAEPEHSDAAILKATGLSWDAWVERIDAGPGRTASHTAIAAWVGANSDIGGWWAQGVTVGYERITGMRLPGQMPDGTFTVSRSRTFPASPDAVRALLENDAARGEALPHVTATRTSKAGVKAPRFALTDASDGAALGVLQLAFDPAATGTKVTVTHEKLASFAATDPWKAFWAAWLAQLDEGFAGS